MLLGLLGPVERLVRVMRCAFAACVQDGGVHHARCVAALSGLEKILEGKGRILRNAGISENYGRQFFNGHKKKPSKYQLTAVCIGAGMNLKETQRALKLAGCAELYPRIDVDAAIIICINNGIHKVADIEEFFLKNDITESPFPTPSS